jgi:SAM-dependent methyltransferase
MDIWKYFSITHKEHVLCNPMSVVKHDELIDLLSLEPGCKVLEIATGKGEFITRLAEAYRVSGIGVDISPYFVSDTKNKVKERAPDAEIEIMEMDGASFPIDAHEPFDLAACIGASWVFEGHKGTLEFLKKATVPGGLIVAGEPHWLRDPPEEYLEHSGQKRDDFASHNENVKIGEELGLIPLYTLASNLDDWDRYEGLQWLSTERYVREHPDDPDLDDLSGRSDRSREEYLRWGRDTLGWAIYVFQRP